MEYSLKPNLWEHFTHEAGIGIRGIEGEPEKARRLLEDAQKDVQTRWRMYEYLSERKPDVNGGAPAGGSVNDM